MFQFELRGPYEPLFLDVQQFISILISDVHTMTSGFFSRLTFRQKLRFSFGTLLSLMAINAGVAGIAVISITSQIESLRKIEHIIRTVNQITDSERSFAQTVSREDANQVYQLLESIRPQLLDFRERIKPDAHKSNINSLLDEFMSSFQKFAMEKGQSAALESREIFLGKKLATTMDEARTSHNDFPGIAELNNIFGQLLDTHWQQQELRSSREHASSEKLRSAVDNLVGYLGQPAHKPHDIKTRKIFSQIISDARDYISAFEHHSLYETLTTKTMKDLFVISRQIHNTCTALETHVRQDIRQRIVMAGIVMLLIFFATFVAARFMTSFLSRLITEPISELVDITRRISEGERAARASVVIDDEIGELAICFNKMTENLQRTEDRLLEHNRSLEQSVGERTAELDATNSALIEEVFDHKQTLLALRESKMLLDKTFESLNEAIFIVESGTRRVLDCNKTCETMFGYTREEMIGTTSSFFYTSEEMTERFGHEMLEACTEHGYFEANFTMKRKDGSAFDSEHSITPILDDQGVAAMLVYVVRDISERKRTVESLQNKERYQRALLDNFPFAVWLKDTESRFLAVNQKFAQTFGVQNPDELTGKRDLDIAPHDLAEGYRADDSAVMESRQKKIVEEEILENGVRKWVQTYKAPIIAESGELLGTVGFMQDITEQKEIEKERLKIEKLESLGIFAGGIAHDFNNILTGIMGNLSFARMFIDSSHKSFEALAGAEKASMRATELAHQLLTFARGGEPVKKVVSLRQLVDESASLVLHGSNVKAVIDISDSVHGIEADEGQICQVFHNIIINSTQAMPDGGSLTVSARNETLSAGNTLALPSGTYICLTFTDTGCGIPNENMKRIFDPYFTTKPDGNGLGLASAHSIISKHGGHIGVDSMPGAGTTFSIHLPSTGKPYVPKQTTTGKITANGTMAGSILVMDDEQLIRDVTVHMLRFMGYHVTTCVNGMEAIALYKGAIESGNPYTAVIMDLTIPGGMGGRETAQKILAFDPEARLIVSSGYSDNPIMSNYSAYGFIGAVSKPYVMEDFAQTISSMLAKEA